MFLFDDDFMYIVLFGLAVCINMEVTQYYSSKGFLGISMSACKSALDNKELFYPMHLSIA